MQVYAWMEIQLLIFGIWLWKCFILLQTNSTTPRDEVQGNLSRDTKSNKHTHNKTKVPTQHDSFDLNNVDCVPLNGKFSRFGAVLYIFEDNEAVVRRIIKGRSPTTRHVSRTHRVALNRLLDRVILDCKIQIKYVDTKNQHADMLTASNFTRDEWNNLLYLSNISHSSSLCCDQKFSLISCTRTMAKRMQEQEEDNRIVAKSKPTTMNLAVSVSTSSSTVNSPIAWKGPGILKAPCSSIGKPDARDRNHDAASSSQLWQIDAFLDVSTGKFVAPRISRNSRKLRRLGYRKAMTMIGHTISIFHQKMCCTWRRSSRS